MSLGLMEDSMQAIDPLDHLVIDEQLCLHAHMNGTVRFFLLPTETAVTAMPARTRRHATKSLSSFFLFASALSVYDFVPFGLIPPGSGVSSVMIFQLAPISRIARKSIGR